MTASAQVFRPSNALQIPQNPQPFVYLSSFRLLMVFYLSLQIYFILFGIEHDLSIKCKNKLYFTSFGHKNVEQIRIPYWLTFIQLSLDERILNVHCNVLRCLLYFPIFHANCSPLFTERWEKGSEKAKKSTDTKKPAS